MQGSSGLLIIVVGLIVIYLAVTGRYKCFTGFIACVGGADCSCADKSADKTPTVLTPLTPLRPLYNQ